jgi:hypothetical protein
MELLTFFLLVFIAALASGCWALIVGWNTRAWVGAFVFGALLLVLPAVLPRLIGG